MPRRWHLRQRPGVVGLGPDTELARRLAALERQPAREPALPERSGFRALPGIRRKVAHPTTEARSGASRTRTDQVSPERAPVRTLRPRGADRANASRRRGEPQLRHPIDQGQAQIPRPAALGSGRRASPRVRHHGTRNAAQAAPETFYITDHYAPYAMVLINLETVRWDAMPGILERAWRMVATPRLIKEYDTSRAGTGGS